MIMQWERIVAGLRIGGLAVLTSIAAGCAAPDSNGDTVSSPPAPPPGAAAPPPASGCDAEPAQFAVGQPYTPELGEKVREASGATVVRALRPGQVVTMEYRHDRVSLHVDERGAVTMVTCG